MTYTYQSERKAALVAIVNFGAQAALQTLDGSANYLCHVVVDKYSPFEKATSQIFYTDRKCLIAALEIDPAVPAAEVHNLYFETAFGDIPAQSTLRIVTVTAIAPGGINILWELQGRL